MTDENTAGQAELTTSEARRQSENLLAAAGRVRWCARLAALAVIAAGLVMGGPSWALGAVLGGLVVEINLGLLTRLIRRAAEWRGPSLGPTLMRFYLTFGATIIVCVLIIRNHWGHPLGFLGGLLSFFVGLVLALISMAVRPLQDK
ncbi:hypothetical protein C4J81_01180 [Deltaproteobacteria bacterium Smac51]|nr:hypothetical protein C4J81_01180 [Deltaproteobacteria bacterium Smac51]